MMLTQLATIARRTGYPVVEVSGWETRGRPGGMKDIRTIICHHTANGGAPGNFPSLRVVRDGRLGLPGPLAQYGLGVDGTIYVIAAGKSNHAGVSRSVLYTNSYAIGIEAEAVGVPGNTTDWPPPQRESYERLCRALMNHYDLSPSNIKGHKETCSPPGRKSDPSFRMDPFRADVAVTNLNNPPKELPMSAAELKALKDAVGAVPTAAEIVAALRPVIKAEVATAVSSAAALAKAWQSSPVDLGPMAGAALPGVDGLPAAHHTAGNLLQWAAAHSAETHALVVQLRDILTESPDPGVSTAPPPIVAPEPPQVG
jgi:hypothetical protein